MSAAIQARAEKIADALDQTYPEATCALTHESPLQLLVATILSAQCTDERVNKVTPELFKKYRDARALAAANRADLEAMVRSTGFFRNKAKSIQGAAQAIASRHGGEVPKTMEELLELPGVARKTANVVLGTAFGIASGFVVDTHVGRLTRRMGLTKEEDPVKVERDMQSLLPQARWILTAHRLIWHGRRVCKARSPNCEGCMVNKICPSAFRAA